MAIHVNREIILVLMLAAWPFGHALAEVYNPKNYDADVAAGWAQIKKTCHKSKGIRCLDDQVEKMEAAGRMRGSQTYVDKHYKPLGNDGLLVKYRELEELQKTARTSLINVKPGEVTFNDYDSEMKMLSAEYKKRTGKPILPAGCVAYKAAPGLENSPIYKKMMTCKGE
jgi:hypothetical protein